MKKIFLKSISFSYIYIFVYLLTGLLVTPMLLKEYGSSYFALLMLIYAFITYLNHIRLGIPESLAVTIAKEKNKSNNSEWIKKSFYLLILIIFITIVILVVVTNIIDNWYFFLGNINHVDYDILKSIFYILVIFALIKIPFELALFVFIGFNEVFLEKLYKIITITFNFILVLFAVKTHMDIVTFSIYAGTLDLIVSLCAFIHTCKRYNIFNIQKDKIQLNTPFSKKLINSGFHFFQLSIIQTLTWGIGIFIVSHIFMLKDVTIYSLTMKIYTYLFFVLTIVNTITSPLYGKYFSENDWSTLSKIFNMSNIILPFIGGLIWIGTLFFMSEVIYLWTGSNEYFIGYGFIFFMGIFFYLIGFSNTFITFIFSIGKAKEIIFIRWVEIFINITLALFCIYFFGIVGVAMGLSLAVLLGTMPFMIKYTKSKSFYEFDLNFIVQKKQFLFILFPSVVIGLLCSIYNISIILKVIVFIIVTSVYLYSSWHILPPYNKKVLINFLKWK